MWPMLVCAWLPSVSLANHLLVWHEAHCATRDAMRSMDALARGNVDEAARLSSGSRDPVIQMVGHGLNDLKLPSGGHAGRRGRRVSAGGTIYPGDGHAGDVGPLMGLLGTVTGIMRSFTSMGAAELAWQGHGPAIGEALIATAWPGCGHHLADPVELLSG